MSEFNRIIVVVNEQGQERFDEIFENLGSKVVFVDYASNWIKQVPVESNSIIFFNILMSKTKLAKLTEEKVANNMAKIFLLDMDNREMLLSRFEPDVPIIDFISRPPRLREIINKISMVLTQKKMCLEISKYQDQLNKNEDKLRLFTSAITHELSSPLRYMRLGLEMVQGELSKTGISAKSENFKLLLGNIAKLEIISEQLSELVKFKFDKEDYQVIELNRTITSVLSYLEPEITKARAQLKVDDNLPSIMINGPGIFIVLKNVLKNALIYNGKRGSTISISRDDVGIYHIITVVDHGIGINPKYLTKIFEPFKRLHSYEDFEGLGLGLYISQQIIEDIGGKIEISSQLDKGTTVQLFLPKS